MPLYFTDKPTAKYQHANHKDRADHHGDPGADQIGEIFLERHDHKGADDGTKKGAAAAQERHQDDFA